MGNPEVATAPRSQYVDFWNSVLVPKFVRWRHILVGGLTLHSAKVFPSLGKAAKASAACLSARSSLPRFSKKRAPR